MHSRPKPGPFRVVGSVTGRASSGDPSRTFRRFFNLEKLPETPPEGMADIRTWTTASRMIGERIGAFAHEEVDGGDGISRVGDCVPNWLVDLSLAMMRVGFDPCVVESTAREIAGADFRNPNIDAWLAALALVELQNA